MKYVQYIASRGARRVFHFENGYSASAVNYGYGGDVGLWELAVKWGNWVVTDTPITDDVLGWLTWEDVLETCEKIAQLPPR